jgi:UTP--glucose-1-phosphate uridylyltransferase
LPVTKSVPLELLPIASKPLIQYAVEEAVASGLETVILVVGRGTRLLADYFRPNPSLERQLILLGRKNEVDLLRQLSERIDIRVVWQDSSRGLAHAVSCTSSQVGDEPFVVILPEALIRAAMPCTRQLIDCYEKHQGCVIATRKVQSTDVGDLGIIGVFPSADPCCNSRTMRVMSLSHEPQPEGASFCYAVFGRYVLDPAIFSSIGKLNPGMRDKLELIDALMTCSNRPPVYAYCFEGTHYNVGDQLGFLQANIDYSLDDPRISYRMQRHGAS